MIVGGPEKTEMITEVWDESFNSSRTIEPTLTGYYFYPILNMVPYNFGKPS